METKLALRPLFCPVYGFIKKNPLKRAWKRESWLYAAYRQVECICSQPAGRGLPRYAILRHINVFVFQLKCTILFG